MANKSTVKSGNFSDATVWGGSVPVNGDFVLINSGHSIQHDISNITLAGANILGTWNWNPNIDILVQSTANVVFRGSGFWRSVKTSRATKHTLRFTGINENNFIGGGMAVLASDIGCWVMENARVELRGTPIKTWTRVTDTVASGQTSFAVKETPSGWQIGDKIVLVPTDKPGDTLDYFNGQVTDSFWVNFEERTLSAVAGVNLQVSQAFARNSHNKVVTPEWPTAFTAEILNLERDIWIEGTAGGRAHFFFHTQGGPHIVDYVGARYLGPRKDFDGNGRKDMVAGRYSFHWHHCFEASAGTSNQGCLSWQCGNHSFVPHFSNRINQSKCAGYDIEEVCNWWDFSHQSHGIIWEDILIAKNFFTPQAADMAGSESGTFFTGTGMLLGIGDDNIARRNVIVHGGLGDTHGKGGFIWEANNEGIWIFEDNMAHSNHNAIRVWQNTVRNHTVINQICYNNMINLFHGAYGNAYTYRGGIFLGVFDLKATSANSVGVRFEDMIFDGMNTYDHVVECVGSPIPSGDSNPDLFINCRFVRYTGKAFLMATVAIPGETVTKVVGCVNCFFGGPIAAFHPDSVNNSYLKIQPASGQSIRIAQSGNTNISRFSPTAFGSGMGLKGEYYTGTAFNNLVHIRLDSVIMFTEWTGDRVFMNNPEGIVWAYGIHHTITGAQFSIKHSGKVQAQTSGQHRFRLRGACGYRMWLDNVLIIDSPGDKGDQTESATSSFFTLTQGAFYDVRVETYNSGGPAGLNLEWEGPDFAMTLIPQSQLYAELPVTQPVTTFPGQTTQPVTTVPHQHDTTQPVTTIPGQTTQAPQSTIPQTTQQLILMPYNPSKHTVSNKAYGPAGAFPGDTRTYFYDETLFKYRPYRSTAEVLAYLTGSTDQLTKDFRTGHFPIIVNIGGTLQSDGSFVGGEIRIYMFRDGQADANLDHRIKYLYFETEAGHTCRMSFTDEGEECIPVYEHIHD